MLKLDFEAVLVPESGYSFLYIPLELCGEIPEKGRVRVKGLLNNTTPFNLAIQRKKGAFYLMVGSSLRREAKLKIGDTVKVACEAIDPDSLEIPEVVEAILEQDAEARQKFEAISIGKKRNVLIYVKGVKNPDLKIQRFYYLLDRQYYGITR